MTPTDYGIQDANYSDEDRLDKIYLDGESLGIINKKGFQSWCWKPFFSIFFACFNLKTASLCRRRF
jgi:hypothetical protein